MSGEKTRKLQLEKDEINSYKVKCEFRFWINSFGSLHEYPDTSSIIKKHSGEELIPKHEVIQSFFASTMGQDYPAKDDLIDDLYTYVTVFDEVRIRGEVMERFIRVQPEMWKKVKNLNHKEMDH